MSWKEGLPALRRGYMQWSANNRLAGRPGTAEIGFALDPSVWGTGVFRTAAALMCGFAFDTIKLHRLEMRIAVDNRRAQTAAHKLGATPEGLLRDAFAKDGRYCDSVLFRLLKGELSAQLR